MQDVDHTPVRERAYQIWEDNGRPDGAHESHWHQALAELGLASPVKQAAGSILGSDQVAADQGSDGRGVPPARNGKSAQTGENPTESGGVGNPTHHTGHLPPPVKGSPV